VSGPQANERVHRIQTGVFGKRFWNYFDRVGKGDDCQLFPAAKRRRVVAELHRDLNLRSATSCDDFAIFDRCLNDSNRVIHSSVSLFDDMIGSSVNDDADDTGVFTVLIVIIPRTSV